jgi:alpha-galactosidase
MAAPAAMPEFKGNVVAVQTAPFWSEELGAIADKHEKAKQIRYFLDSKHKDHPNADGHMTEEQKQEYVKSFEAKLISPEEAALWKRGASNAGYHYLGCAKTFALMGQAFAEAMVNLQKTQRQEKQRTIAKPQELSRNPPRASER